MNPVQSAVQAVHQANHRPTAGAVIPYNSTNVILNIRLVQIPIGRAFSSNIYLSKIGPVLRMACYKTTRFATVRMAERSKVHTLPCPISSQCRISGPRMWAWVRIPLLTYTFYYHSMLYSPFNYHKSYRPNSPNNTNTSHQKHIKTHFTKSTLTLQLHSIYSHNLPNIHPYNFILSV